MRHPSASESRVVCLVSYAQPFHKLYYPFKISLNNNDLIFLYLSSFPSSTYSQCVLRNVVV